MKTICAWCHKELSPENGCDVGEISHGICPSCREWFEEALVKPEPLERFLDRMQAPVLLVDEDVVALAANAAAVAALGKPLAEIKGFRGGDVIECEYARLPQGCGKTVHCEACTLRNTVSATYRDGHSRRRVEAFRDLYGADGSLNRVRILISTEKVGPVVLLRIEELTKCP